MSNFQKIKLLTDHISKAYIGSKHSVALIVMALLADGHILIEDVPGTGKTTLALALAKAIDGIFKRVSCTPDIMPSDILGFSVYNPKTGNFEYKPGPIISNVFLADEINRMPPKSQSGLLEAMQERSITIDNNRLALPSPFVVIATQNPIEYLGTYALPEAQLDRFIVKVKLGYPNQSDELCILQTYQNESPINALSAVMSLNDIKELQEHVSNVLIKDDVMQYIIRLVDQSRKSQKIDLGLSTRAALSIAKMAKAHAYFDGRDYATPDDIKAIFLPTTSHRIVMSHDATANNETADSIMLTILEQTPVRG